jgi:hypothetical protein
MDRTVHTSEGLLERALHFRRLADATRGGDPGAASDLERLAFKYLELAEAAQLKENAGRPLRGV